MKFKLRFVEGTFIGFLQGATGTHVFESDSLTPEQVKVLIGTPTEDDVINIFNPRLKEVREENIKTQGLIDVLLDSGLFEEKDGAYYRVGNPISVPKSVLEEYKRCLTENDEKGLSAIEWFWLKNSLAFSPKVRQHLFDFIQKCGNVRTPLGNFIAYRNVKILREGNRELAKFVTDNYIKIKGQKKSPKNYDIYRNNSGYFVKSINYVSNYDVENPDRFEGNLHEMYVNIDEISETVYTYAYTGSGAGKGLDSKEIRVGKWYEIKEEAIDTSEDECSSGLHACSWDFLGSSYALGEVKMAVLINPMDARSFPTTYGKGKGRFKRMLPLGEVTAPITDASEWEENDEEVTLEHLNKTLQEIDPTNQVVHKLTFEELPNQVYTSIDKYRSILEKKNVNLYQSKFDFDEDDYEDDYEDEEWDDDYDDEFGH